jgi:hypothetical protein
MMSGSGSLPVSPFARPGLASSYGIGSQNRNLPPDQVRSYPYSPTGPAMPRPWASSRASRSSPSAA